MKVNLSELLKIQKTIDASADQLIVGFNIKVFSLLDTFGYWRWDTKEISIKRDDAIESLVDVLEMFIGLLLNTQYSNPTKNVLETYEQEIIDTFENLKDIQKEVPIYEPDLMRNWTVLIATDNETGNTISTMQRMSIILFMVETIFHDLDWQEIIDAYRNKHIA